jgi:hypothetical protein
VVLRYLIIVAIANIDRHKGKIANQVNSGTLGIVDGDADELGVGIDVFKLGA